jgi:DNA repair ATPase RecN
MNGNGNGNGTTVALLELIADKLDTLKSIDRRLENVENRLENVENRLGNVEHKLDQVVDEQTKTNRRLDNMLVFMGRHHGDHEQRIAALEQEVFKKSG